MKELLAALKKRKVILFVGAGVSNCLGLPSWDELIRSMAKDLGFDPDIFVRLGNHMTLAEYYVVRKKIEPLRNQMDVEWHKPSIKIADSEIHKKIVELGFPIIYTTNYDRWLERAFEYYGKPYTKIVQIDDIARIKEGVTQIIKFHGDFDDDRSLVLTESSYYDRLDFESPLDIKLRSDILGHSVLYIGYGLRDLNIRFLLFRLSRLWLKANGSKNRPTSYLFMSRPNPIEESILKRWGITPLTIDEDNPEEALDIFLTNLL